MKKIVLSVISIFSISAFAQFPGCPNIVAGPDQVLPCTQNCTTISATPFHSGATNTYSVGSIPHTPPIAYNAAGGTAVSVGTDDVWSPIINLPFPFCYYGQTYTTCKVGSNGAIDFAPAGGGGGHPWSFTASCPNTALVNAGDIFGAYHDIDPSINTGSQTVRWYLLGTAPCRIFVVSFNNIGHFSCTSMRTTQMIVLYETTNVIDVYVQRKDLCTGWNGGRAIIGIQNPAGTAGIAAPGRNAAPTWSVPASSPEGWRFTPNGAPIYTVEWYTGAVAGVGGTLIGTGNSINVCPNGVTTTYTAKITYTRCDGVQITDYDELVVSYAALPAPTVTPVAETCAGYNNGSVTINNNVGSGPYTVTINGPTTATVVEANTAPAVANFTNLPDGNYTYTVTAANGCVYNGTFTINAGPSCCSVSAASTPALCFGQASGTATATPSGGVPGYSYVWFNAAMAPIGQTTQTATNLAAGTYNVTLTDGSGCTSTATVVVGQPASALNATSTVTNISCFGNCNGSIVINAPSGGTPGYQYSMNGGALQPSGTFNGLCVGTYNMIVQDANGCQFPIAGLNVTQPADLTLAQTAIAPATCGLNNGSVTVTAGGGTPTYTYSIGATTNTTGVFNGLAAGNHVVTVTDNNGCTETLNITIASAAGPVAFVDVLNNVACFGGATGSVTIGVSGGTPGYQYSLDGGPNQASNTFNAVIAGAHTVTVTDLNGCQGSIGFTITQPTALNFSNVTVNASCNGVCDGQITVNASNATPPYMYSSNNGLTFQSSNVLTDLCAGNINVVVQDDNGCLANATVNITQPPVLTSVQTPTDPECHQTPTGQIAFTPAGGTPGYSFSVDNGATFTGSNPITGLMAGDYDVVVEDNNGCQFTTTVTLTDPPPFTFNFIANNPSNCGAQDGSFEIVADNGVGPYLYSIDGGVTTQVDNGFFGSLFSGLYNLVVEDANGCIDSIYSALSDNVMVTQVDFTQNTTCYNGTDGLGIVSQMFGAAPYTYSIVPDPAVGPNVNGTGIFGNLAAGTYYVTVEDNGLCIAIEQFEILQPDSILFTPTPTPTTCNGGSDGVITITGVTGGSGTGYTYSIDGGATYQASNTFNGLAAGTYICFVQDDNGCLGYDVVTITEPIPFDVVINPADLTCFNNNTGFAQIVASGSNPGAYTYTLGGTTNGTGIFAGLAANTYNITVTDILGCTYNTTQDILEPAQLTANYNLTDASCFDLCDGEIEVIAAGGTPTYLYSADGGVTYQSSNVLDGLCAGNHTVMVKDDNNCTVSAVQVINEPTEVTHAVVITPSTCGLPNGEIVVNANGGTPGYTYSSDFGVTFQASNTFAGLNTDNYDIIVEDANGCQSSSLEFVPSEASPVITGVALTNITCNGDCDGSIVVTATGGTGALTYDIGGAGQATGNFGSLCPNTYTITVTDVNGCTDTQTETITEPTLLSHVSVNTNLTCFNDNSGNIEITANGGTSPYQYSFDGGATFIVQNEAQFISAGSYDIEVMDDNGCISASTEIITEPDLLEVTSQNATDASCFGECDGDVSLTVAGGTGAYTYNWDGGIAGPSATTASALCAGGYSVTVEDANGCITSAVFLVNEPAMLGFTSVSGTDPLCNGGCDGTILVNAMNATGYSVDNGATFGGANFFSGLCAGTYDVVIQNAAGCTQTQTFTLSEPTPVVLDPIADITICYDGFGSLNAFASGGSDNYYYVWDTGDTTQSLTVNLTLPATFSVTAYDMNGCASNVQSADVSLLPQFFGTVAPDTVVICPGDPASFTAGNNGGGLAPYSYTWTTSAADTVGVGANLTYTPTQPETIYMAAQDACGATDTIPVVVVYNGLPVPAISVDPGIGCAPLTVNFEDITAISNASLTVWNFGNGFSATGATTSSVYTEPGCYDVSVTVTSVDGCVASATFDDAVCVNPNPVAGFYWNPNTPNTLDPTITIVDISENAEFYEYNFGGTGTSFEQNPTYTFPNILGETVVEVCQVVTSSDGCTDTVCADVTIVEDIMFYVPNVFTPDGDPNNNTFFPVMTSGVDMYEYHLTIYNRWGEIVFESYDYQYGWDGTYADQGLVQDGVYIWVIEFGDKVTDKQYKHRGHVTVLK